MLFTPSQVEITRAYYRGDMDKVLRRYERLNLACAVVFATALTIGAFVALYVTKSALGINIFEWHLADLI